MLLLLLTFTETLTLIKECLNLSFELIDSTNEDFLIHQLTPSTAAIMA